MNTPDICEHGDDATEGSFAPADLLPLLALVPWLFNLLVVVDALLGFPT